MRVCKFCGQNKTEAEYSSPFKEFLKKTQKWKLYLRKRCKDCELAYNRERYKKLKDSPEFKAKNNQYAKISRQTQKRKDYMKQYFADNKDKLDLSLKRRVKKYSDKISKNLSDTYVKRIIKKHKNASEITESDLQSARVFIIKKRIARLINQLDSL